MHDDTVAARFWAKVAKGPGCWEWTASRMSAGYGHLSVGGTPRLAHRVSWELHYGPIPPGLHVCHTCDNPPCVRPDHLFLGTDAANHADKAAKGRARGSRNGYARLTEDDVRTIRSLLATGMALQQVADRMGVTESTIRHIKAGRRWGWLQ